MKQNKITAKASIPPKVENALLRLGENISIARKRRQWTIKEMAERIFVSRQTLSRLEHGDSGITLSVLASALWILGMENQLYTLINPEKDKVGIFHERQKLSKRIRNKSANNKLDF